MSSYFILSVLIFAVMLFFPVSKMIWVISVRRLEKKLQRQLTSEELSGQLARARFIALPVVLIFSFLFNLNMIGLSPNGT